jgi:hypothetical protein
VVPYDKCRRLIKRYLAEGLPGEGDRATLQQLAGQHAPWLWPLLEFAAAAGGGGGERCPENLRAFLFEVSCNSPVAAYVHPAATKRGHTASGGAMVDDWRECPGPLPARMVADMAEHFPALAGLAKKCRWAEIRAPLHDLLVGGWVLGSGAHARAWAWMSLTCTLSFVRALQLEICKRGRRASQGSMFLFDGESVGGGAGGSGGRVENDADWVYTPMLTANNPLGRYAADRSRASTSRGTDDCTKFFRTAPGLTEGERVRA